MKFPILLTLAVFGPLAMALSTTSGGADQVYTHHLLTLCEQKMNEEQKNTLLMLSSVQGQMQ